MKGEYDSVLDWSFEGDIIIELINQREDKSHLSHTIVFDHTQILNIRLVSLRMTFHNMVVVVIMIHSLTPLFHTILSLTQSIFMMTVSSLELESTSAQVVHVTFHYHNTLNQLYEYYKSSFQSLCLSLFKKISRSEDIASCLLPKTHLSLNKSRILEF